MIALKDLRVLKRLKKLCFVEMLRRVRSPSLNELLGV